MSDATIKMSVMAKNKSKGWLAGNFRIISARDMTEYEEVSTMKKTYHNSKMNLKKGCFGSRMIPKTI